MAIDKKGFLKDIKDRAILSKDMVKGAAETVVNYSKAIGGLRKKGKMKNTLLNSVATKEANRLRVVGQPMETTIDDFNTAKKKAKEKYKNL